MYIARILVIYGSFDVSVLSLVIELREETLAKEGLVQCLTMSSMNQGNSKKKEVRVTLIVEYI